MGLMTVIRRNLILILVLAFLHITAFYGILSIMRRKPEQLPRSRLLPKGFVPIGDNITGYPCPIVPNIVHYIKFRSLELGFHELVSMLSVLRNHRPDRILIHCSKCTNSSTLRGKYWDMLLSHRPPVQVVRIEEPTHIYGQKFSSPYHASDVVRIQILMKHGGIFLDGDVYVVNSLDRFRHFEMALGWPEGEFLGTQVLVAHKNARFLPLWLNSYHQYDGSRWYYNAGELPTKSILNLQPELVHRVPVLFGVHELVRQLYLEVWPEWTNYYAVHLLIRHLPFSKNTNDIETFDEFNIKTFNCTFGQMARLVLYNTTELVF